VRMMELGGYCDRKKGRRRQHMQENGLSTVDFFIMHGLIMHDFYGFPT
jgi:hypothetical protein